MELMKAAVFNGVENMQVKEVPKPICEKDGILIKVEACSICGGDIRNFHNGLRHGIESQIMGHEIGGIIEEIGDEVGFFKKGDRVALAPDVSCGQCVYCKRGLVNLCNDHKMLGTHWAGGFAQYVYLPKQVWTRGFIEKIPDTMSYDQAALAEPASSVIACQEYNNVKVGDVVVIIGDGPIGCLHIEVARARGASKIVMVGLDKLHLVPPFKPDHTIHAINQDPVKEVLELTDGIGADIVICANPVTKTQQQAVEMVRKRGRVVLFGGAPKNNAMTTLDSNRIHYNEITVVGAFSYPSNGLEQAIKYISEGLIHTELYIHNLLPLEHIVEGIAFAETGKGLKVIMKPWNN
ncbi:MAG: alcohol dehydrogenase catalytic domain-containing protein [Vallitaleaceae bacterium]|nr:alcohol dehydrogenase catalytic domain-containing protein [Vallitaleaceae bacterium]